MAIALDRQRQFLRARKKGETIADIARRFDVSPSTVRYWLKKADASDGARPGRGPGRPSILSPEEQEQLRELALERSELCLREILELLAEMTGKRLLEGTARQYLTRMGVRRVRPVREKGDGSGGEQDRSTRYRPHHRRKPTRKSYPSDLTDPEWKLLEPVFDPEGRPGRPSSYDRRRILDAIFYVVRGGIPWRQLPHDFPPWENVYSHFRRWSEGGLFEKMHDLLRAQWRKREGRKPGATGSIIDSQSVKTTEKGGSAVTTRGRRSRGGSDTSS
jgi:putative transposase